MKRFILLLFIGTCFGVKGQPSPGNFVLKGKVTGLDNGTIYLYYTGPEGKSIRDSSALKDGKFSFEGHITGADMAYLSLKEEKRSMNNSTSFFLEPSKMTAVLPYNNFPAGTFTGSKTQDEYGPLVAKKLKIRDRWSVVMDTLDAVNKRSNVEFQKLKDWVLTPYEAEMKELDYDFFAAHPQSPATAYQLRFYVGSLPLDSLQMYYDRLGSKMQQTTEGKSLAKEIEKLRGGSPGSMAKNFTTKDINGKEISLSDFKGKYVLLDFWASWCVPCRAGNPHLKELYAKYHDKGIEFIGVSDDDSKPEAWHKAVEKDGLPWRHVLRGFDMQKLMNNEVNPNDISEKFGIHSLPTKILIDPNGKIIGRYSEESEPLDAELKSVFGS